MLSSSLAHPLSFPSAIELGAGPYGHDPITDESASAITDESGAEITD